jgi:hypothetical protein
VASMILLKFEIYAVCSNNIISEIFAVFRMWFFTVFLPVQVEFELRYLR